MVADAAGIAHAGGGDDDFRLGIGIDGLGLVRGDGGVQSRKYQRVLAPPHDGRHLIVHEVQITLQKDPGGFHRQRAVHIDGKTVVAPDEAPVLDLPDEVEHLLGAADGKGRDDHIAAPVHGGLDDLRQFGHVVRVHPLVIPVAVGGLHHQILGLLHGLGIPQDGLIGVAQVAGEGDLPFLAVLREPHLDAGRSQQVPHIREPDGHTVVDLDHLMIAAWDHGAQQALHILHVVNGFHRGVALPHLLAGLPFRLLHLDMGTVLQHDIAQVAGGLRGKHVAPESLFVQKRKVSGVIDMGMGQQHKIDLPCRHRQFGVFEQVLPLFHTAVNEALFIPDFQQRHAAGHLMGGANKRDLQSKTPRSR